MTPKYVFETKEDREGGNVILTVKIPMVLLIETEFMNGTDGNPSPVQLLQFLLEQAKIFEETKQ